MLYISLCWGLMACHRAPAVGHVLHLPDTLFYPKPDSLVLQWPEKAPLPVITLMTIRQPVPLLPHRNRQQIVMPLYFPEGLCDGQAILVCESGGKSFFYPLHVAPMPGYTPVSTLREYRSPKTVNTDSSLIEQRIMFRFDAERILMPLPRQLWKVPPGLFYADTILLPPVAGTYMPESNKPISAVYVQPGTNTGVRLQVGYHVNERYYLVQTNLLRDRYGNVVADGTSVAFVYTADSVVYRQESVVVKGVAMAKIPAEGLQHLRIQAITNNGRSASVNASTTSFP